MSQYGYTKQVRKKVNKKIFISLLLVAMFNFLIGCYHFKSVTVPEYEEFEYKEGKPNEIYVKTKDGYWYYFINSNYYVDKDTLYGVGSKLSDDWQKAENFTIALSNIESMGVEDMNYVTTGLLWFIAIGGVIVSILAIWWIFFTEKEIKP
jgi:hypothetical protein